MDKEVANNTIYIKNAITNSKLLPTYLKKNRTFMDWLIKKNVEENSDYHSLNYFPTSLNSKDSNNNLQISHSGQRALYTGPGNSDTEVGSVRADYTMPPQSGIYYFEVEILDKGRKGLIGIGFCQQTVRLNRLPGWEPTSWGYHGDDGYTFNCTGSGASYGPKFTKDDIIGCGVNFYDNTAFFTKNGRFLGKAFENISNEIYPCVGLSTPNEKVGMNFGSRPFKFDIECYYQEQKNLLWQQINNEHITLDLSQVKLSPIKSSSINSQENHANLEEIADHTTSAINILITSYLVHHGYSNTARCFAKNALGIEINEDKSMNMKKEIEENSVQNQVVEKVKAELSNDNKEDILNRQELRSFILKGDIDSAFQLIDDRYSKLFNDHPDLKFQMSCQKFVEMIIELEELAKREQGNTDDIPDSEMVSPISDKRKRQTNDHDGLASKTTIRKSKVEAILSFGQQLEEMFGEEESNTELLQEIFSLLAYQVPSNSASSYVMDVKRREYLVNEVIGAIFVSQNRPPVPPLEVIYRHASVITECMAENDLGDSGFISIADDIL